MPVFFVGDIMTFVLWLLQEESIDERRNEG